MNLNPICLALEQLQLPYLITDSTFRILWRNSCLQERYSWLSLSPTLDSLLYGYNKVQLLQELLTQKEPLTLNCRLPLLAVTMTLSLLPNCEDEPQILVSFTGQPNLKDQQTSLLSSFHQNLSAPISQLFSTLSMLNHRLDEEYIPYLQSMTRDCYRMLRTCISVSEYSEYLGGTAALKKEYQELGRWLKDQLEPAIPMLERSGITLTYTLPEKPIFTAFDSEKLAVVLFSLLSNSCMFCEQNNSIHVTLTAREHNAILSISDKGRGIPAEVLPHVLEPYFSRGLDETEQPGIGLGLPLSQAILEQHGGTLALQSVQDEGTTVSISLPIRQELSSSTLPLRSAVASYGSNRYNKRNIFLSAVLPPEEFQ